MRLTNKHNLPSTIVRATIRQADLYNAGPVHRSVTQLINSPRIDSLRVKHYADIEADVTDEWWALLGSAVHHILELGADSNTIVEQRLFAEIDGWHVSGQIDVQEFHEDGRVSLNDYKVTSAYVVKMEKADWEQQLNLLAYLMYLSKGIIVTEIAIIAIVRDWQRAQAKNNPEYPQAPIVKIVLPLWTLAEQERYATARVNEHRHTEMLMELGETLPECTEEDRWEREASWAVTKAGNKKPTKVFDNIDDAEAFATKGDYTIEHRPGESVRCAENYCRVSAFCSQWKGMRDGS